MLNLRLVVPLHCSDAVVRTLIDDPRVTNVMVWPGAGREPEGDAVSVDVAREAVHDILTTLRALGVDKDAGVALSAIEASPSTGAKRAEQAAPGAPDDAVVWDVVEERAADDARTSWSFFAFLTLATMIAAVAVVTDSPILVVGAMVVGPEFAAVSAIAVGLALARRRLATQAARLLVAGFVVAIVVTTAFGLVARAVGWIDPSSLTASRPLTAFIWRPDKWSIVVALLAGTAGVLSQTGGKSNALVGVFISVTTVPAAGNLALALAVWVPSEMGGAAEQLGVNLVGMTVAGVLTLLVQQAVWRRVPYHVGPPPEPTAARHVRTGR